MERIGEIEELNVYLPLVLCGLVSVDYLYRLDDKEKKKYYQHRTELMRTNDYNGYLEKDLMEWLKEHKEYKDILL